jgi:hypothetical protein
MERAWAVLLAVAILVVGSPACGQYIYIDADGDGINTSADVLGNGTMNSLDIWIVTDRNRDGAIARSAASGVAMSIFSYEFILHAEGGEVKWGEYVNAEPSMIVPFRRRENAQDLYLGYGGIEPLKAGKHRVGRLQVSVLTGSPRIGFASESSIEPSLGTSFGSLNPGIEGDNSIRFGPVGDNARRPEGKREWFDSDGVRCLQNAMAPTLPASVRSEFRVSITAGSLPGRTALTVSTGQPGALKARLFDVQGRLVRTLIDDPYATPGVRTVELGSGGEGSLASGIYFYQVKAADRITHGKVVLLR